MNTKAVNYGKTVTAILDALLSAGINTEEAVGCFEGSDALIFYGADDEAPEESIYQLLAEVLDDEQLEKFKAELTDAVEHSDVPERANQRTVENFITAGKMMGMSSEEMSEDVAKIIRALKNGEELKIPRMEDVWDLPETHDWSRG